MALGRQRNHAHTPAMLLSNSLACDTHVKRDATILITSADHLVALCAEHSLPYWAAVGKALRGLCLSRLGHSDEAIARAMAALADYQATGSVTVVPMLLTFIAEALHSARRSNEGVEKLDEAIRQIEATGERWTESDTHRVRGDPLVAVGETVAAERSFHQAIGAARRQNAKLFELRGAASLARLWRGQGKHIEARDLLAPVYEWFTEGFDAPVLREAKALLDELN